MMVIDSVVCDFYALSLRVEGEIAHFMCQTDLPPGTQVIILAKRFYRLTSGKELVWDGLRGDLDRPARVAGEQGQHHVQHREE